MLGKNSYIAHGAFLHLHRIVKQPGNILGPQANHTAAIHEQRNRIILVHPRIPFLWAFPILSGLLRMARPASGLIFRNRLHFPVGTLPEQIKQGRRQGFRGRFHILQFFRENSIRFQAFQNIIHQGFRPQLVHLDGGHHRFWSQLDADKALNPAHQRKIAAPYKRNGFSLAPGARSAADAVHVILRIARQFKIHHGIHIVHVQAPGGNIRSYQQAEAPLAERVHHTLPHDLGHVTVKTVNGIPPGRQAVHDVIHHFLGIGEHQPHLDLSRIQQAAEYLNPGRKHHLVIKLLNRGYRQRRPFNRNLNGILHKTAHQPVDLRRHGGGEKQGLLRFRHGLRDAFDIFQESHVQHLVRFIQNQHAEMVQAQGSGLHQVHHAARGTYHELHAAAQRIQLGAEGGTAINGHRGNAVHEQGQLVHLPANLHGQFPRGTQGQHLDGALIRINALQGRNGKRKRFAGTGMGKPHNIRPSDGRGNGLFLDGGRGVEAENLDGLQNFR